MTWHTPHICINKYRYMVILNRYGILVNYLTILLERFI